MCDRTGQIRPGPSSGDDGGEDDYVEAEDMRSGCRYLCSVLASKFSSRPARRLLSRGAAAGVVVDMAGL